MASDLGKIQPAQRIIPTQYEQHVKEQKKEHARKDNKQRHEDEPRNKKGKVDEYI